MTVDSIPGELVDLLREHVETYEQLEVLLLLGRDKDRVLSAEAVASELGVSGTLGSEALEQLTAAGLLSRTSDASGSRFQCRPDSLPLLDKLTRAYREDRIDLMRLMTNNALDRVRTSALRTFAAAFRLRRGHDG